MCNKKLIKGNLSKFIIMFLLAFAFIFTTTPQHSYAEPNTTYTKEFTPKKKDGKITTAEMERVDKAYKKALKYKAFEKMTSGDISGGAKEFQTIKDSYRKANPGADADAQIQSAIKEVKGKFTRLSKADKDKLAKALDDGAGDLSALKAILQDTGALEVVNEETGGTVNLGQASSMTDLSAVPDGSLLAHIYFSKTKASDTTNDLTLSLNEIASWRSALTSPAEGDSKPVYGQQSLPKNTVENADDELASLISGLYKYNWLAASDSKSKSKIPIIRFIQDKVDSISSFFEKANLGTATVTSSAYLAIVKYTYKMFAWIGQFSLVNMLGFNGGNNDSNWLSNLLGQTGLGELILRPASKVMYAIFCSAGALYLILKLRKGLTKQNFNKAKDWGYFTRAITILLTIPLSLTIFNLTSSIMGDIASKGSQDASNVNESYFVDTLAWAITMNLDTTPISGSISVNGSGASSSLRPTEDKIRALNQAIKARTTGEMQESMKDITGDDELGLASAVSKFRYGEMATVEDYIKGIEAAGNNAAYSARLMPTFAGTAIKADEETYIAGEANPYFLVTKGDEDIEEPKKQEKKKKPEKPDEDKIKKDAEKDGKDPDEAIKKAKEKYEKAMKEYEKDNEDMADDDKDKDKKKKKKGQKIQLAGKKGESKTITITKDSKMEAKQVRWNAPSTYIYGAALVGSSTVEEVKKDNYIFGPKSRQSYNPEKGSNGKFFGNAAAIALANMNAGTSGALPGPLSTQSTAFLLQSTLKDGALSYRGFNTVSSKSGETKMVGLNGTQFLRYTMPAKNQTERNAKISQLNMRWSVSLVAAVVAILAAVKTPLIKGVFNSFKGFFGALFRGDCISLMQHLLWQLCVMASLTFVEVGVAMGGTVGAAILGIPFLGDLIAFLQKIPILGPLTTFALIYLLYKVFTFKVINTAGLQLNLIEAIVVIPYLVIDGFTKKMDFWRPFIYGPSAAKNRRGEGLGMSDDLNSLKNKASDFGRNTAGNTSALGSAMAGALGGAAGTALMKNKDRLKNGISALSRNTGDGDANLDSNLGYGGIKSKLNGYKTQANANRLSRVGIGKDGKPNLDKDGNLVDAQGNILGKPKIDENGNLVKDKDGNILDEKGNIIATPMLNKDGEKITDENGNEMYNANKQYYDEDGNLIENPEDYAGQLYNTEGQAVDLNDEADYYDDKGNIITDPENYDGQLFDAAGEKVEYIDPDNMEYYDEYGKLVEDPESYDGQLFNANRQAINYTPEDELYYDDKGNVIEDLDNYDGDVYNNKDQLYDLDAGDIKYFDEDGNLIDNPAEYDGDMFDSHHEQVEFGENNKMNLDSPISADSVDNIDDKEYVDAQGNVIDNLDTFTGDVYNKDGTKIERDENGELLLEAAAAATATGVAHKLNKSNEDDFNADNEDKISTINEADLDPSEERKIRQAVIDKNKPDNKGNNRHKVGTIQGGGLGAKANKPKDKVEKEQAEEIKPITDDELSANISNSGNNVNAEFEKDLAKLNSNLSFNDKTEFDKIAGKIDMSTLSEADLNRLIDEEDSSINKINTAINDSPGNEKVILTGNKNVDDIMTSTIGQVNSSYEFGQPVENEENISKLKAAQQKVKGVTASSPIGKAADKVKGVGSAINDKNVFKLTDEQKLKYAERDAARTTFRDAFIQAGGAIKSGEFAKSSAFAQDLAVNKANKEGNIVRNKQLTNALKAQYLKAFEDNQKDIINSMEKSLRSETIKLKTQRLDALKNFKNIDVQLTNNQNALKEYDNIIKNYDNNLKQANINFANERQNIINNKSLTKEQANTRLNELTNKHNKELRYAKIKYNDANANKDAVNNKIQSLKKAKTRATYKVNDFNKQYNMALDKVNNFSNSKEKKDLEKILNDERNKFIETELQNEQIKAVKQFNRQNVDSKKGDINEFLDNKKLNQQVRDILNKKSKK